MNASNRASVTPACAASSHMRTLHFELPDCTLISASTTTSFHLRSNFELHEPRAHPLSGQYWYSPRQPGESAATEATNITTHTTRHNIVARRSVGDSSLMESQRANLPARNYRTAYPIFKFEISHSRPILKIHTLLVLLEGGSAGVVSARW